MVNPINLAELSRWLVRQVWSLGVMRCTHLIVISKFPLLLHKCATTQQRLKSPWGSREYCICWGSRKSLTTPTIDHCWLVTPLPHLNKTLSKSECEKYHLAPSYCLKGESRQQWHHFLGPQLVQYFLLPQGEIYNAGQFWWKIRIFPKLIKHVLLTEAQNQTVHDEDWVRDWSCLRTISYRTKSPRPTLLFHQNFMRM